MTSISRFYVRLYEFRGSSLAALNRGNTSDPYLTVDFDSFKQFNTEARKKTLNPEWNEDVSFLYETKLAHKVHLKRLKIKCFNQSFLSDKLIGRCYIDLYNIFTGPSEFRLPLRDGHKIRGEIMFKCEVQEYATVEVNMKDLKLDLPRDVNEVYGEHASDFYLEYACSGEKSSEHVRKSPPGRTEFRYLDSLFLRATFDELLEKSITFWLKKRKQFGDDPTVATGDLSLKDHYSFQEGYPVQFRIPTKLTNEFCMENRISLPDIGRISGHIFYGGFPKFLQMESGYFTDNGIYYAKFRDPNVPNKPKVYIHGIQDENDDESLSAKGSVSQKRSVVEHPSSEDRSGYTPKERPAGSTDVSLAEVKHPPPSGSGSKEDNTIGQYSYKLAPASDDGSTKDGGDAEKSSESDSSPDASPSYPFAHLLPPSSSDSKNSPSSYQFASLTGKESNSASEADVDATDGHLNTEGSEEKETQSTQDEHPFSHLIRQASKGAKEKDDESSSTSSDEESEDSIDAGRKQKDEKLTADAEKSKGSRDQTERGESTMLQNKQGLPWFWERIVTNDDKVVFKNHVYQGTEEYLPTESTYTALISKPGSIGLGLERNHSGEAKFGPRKKSGRRFSRQDLGVVVSGYAEDGQASQAAEGRIRKGHQIIALNDVSLLQYDFKTCLRMITQTERPFRLSFLNPYAVSKELAKTVSEPPVPSAERTAGETVKNEASVHPTTGEQDTESMPPNYPFAHLTSQSSRSSAGEEKHPFSHILGGTATATEETQESEGQADTDDDESSSTEDSDIESEDSIAAVEEHKNRNELDKAVTEEQNETAEEMEEEESHMLKNEQGLPWFWERCFTRDNKAFFKNHAYKGTEWKLPTESTYSAMVMFPGPIGLELERNHSGEKKFGPGKKSGRRFSKHDLGAVVASYVDEGQASQATNGRIRRGHQIIALNQVSLLQYDFNTCLKMIARSKRPLRLIFLDPYAVPEELAKKLPDPTVSTEKSVSIGGKPATQSGHVSHPSPATQFPHPGQASYPGFVNQFSHPGQVPYPGFANQFPQPGYGHAYQFPQPGYGRANQFPQPGYGHANQFSNRGYAPYPVAGNQFMNPGYSSSYGQNPSGGTRGCAYQPSQKPGT